MSKELNFVEDLDIDLDNLHEEWKTHANVRYGYACHVTKCDKIVKKIKEKVKILRSQLMKEAKEQGATNAALQEAYYRTNPDHMGFKDEEIEAEYELNMAWNALNAFDDRKKALENEVSLWKSNYFSSPTETREIQMGNPKDNTVDNDARSSMNRKRIRK